MDRVKQIANYLIFAWVFLLPWQTRWIIFDPVLEGSAWEYGRISLYAGDLVFIIALVFGGIVFFKERRLNIYFWPGIFLLSFSFWCLLTLSWAQNYSVAFYYFLRIFQLAILAAMISIVRADKKRILIALIASAFLQAIIAVGQFGLQFVGASKWLGMSGQSAANLGAAVVEAAGGRWLRAYGSLPHPNMLGGFLAIAIVGAIYLFSALEKIKYYLLGLVGVLGLALLFSFSRSAAIGAAVGILFLAVIGHRSKKNLLRIAIASSLLVLIAVFGLIISPDIFISRFDASARLEAISIGERINQVELAWTAIRENPLGVGVGNYTAWLQGLFPSRSGWYYQPVHNIYLLIGAEAGLVGLALFIGLAGAAFIVNKNIYFSKISTFYLAGLAVCLAVGIFDHYFWSSYSGILLFGLLIGCLINKQKE